MFTVEGKLQERLLRESQLDLKKVVEICRAAKLTAKHTKEIESGKHLQSKKDKVYKEDQGQ